MEPTGNNKKLFISEPQLQQMRLEIVAAMPEEGCGLLAGSFLPEGYRVCQVLPMVNFIHSPTLFRMHPEEQYKRFNEIDSMGLELVGIYHSHPQGLPFPSPTDISEAFYPEVAYLIWGISEGEWKCHGYKLSDQHIDPIEIIIYSDE